MAVADKLRSIFGWSSSAPPASRINKGDSTDSSNNPYLNPYQAYNNSIKLPLERRRKYDIYDEMDEIEVVSSILDAYSEDCAQYDREKKAVVWIEAKDQKHKKILEDMLQRVKAEEWVIAECRDVAKYGDDFAHLDIDDEKGIMGIDWKDPRDIERIENNQGTLIGFEETKKLQEVVSKLEKGDRAKYTYKPWDIVHFRLYRRKREKRQKFRNIYGTSILAGSERITKQVKILDDMLVVRRLTKTLDTRIYKIDTAKSSVEEEILILKRWKNALKRKPFIDPTSTQRFDSPFDPFTFQEDLFWPAREDSNSSVDVIPGQPNVADIVDVEYFRDKMFGSLRAPKAYFGYEGDVNAKATLSSQDMKWGRACNGIQQATRNGLTRMCQIELALHDTDALEAEFSVKMVVPSVLEDLSRLEAIQTMIDVAERLAGLGETLRLDSDAWREHILRGILGMSDDEIEKYSSDGSGDDPDTEPDVTTPDTEPDDDAASPESRLTETVRTILLKRLGRTTMHGDITERARAEELPPRNVDRRHAYAFVEGKIVPIAVVQDDDDNPQRAS